MFAWKNVPVLWIGIVAALSVSPVSVSARDKTDVIVLNNGDHITGEIKKLERGRLSLSTNHMGTVLIEWDEIERVTSQYLFEVGLNTGERFYGSMDEAPERQVEIVGPLRTTMLEKPAVVAITPIEDNFWDRLDGYLDVGFDFYRANRETNWTLGGEVRQRTRKRETLISFSSLFTDRKDVESNKRNVLSLSFKRFFAGRWYGTGLGQFTQNQELNLDLRAVAGGGVGRELVQNNKTLFSTLGGVVFTRERFSGERSDPSPGPSPGDGESPTGNAESFNNAEALGSFRFEYFLFDDPEIDIITTFNIYPSLATLGRVRLDLESKIQYELFKDLFWSVNLFDNYDSDPQGQGAERNDFGISTGQVLNLL